MALRKPFEQSYFPPIPTKFTKFLRRNVFYQLFRFVVINAKMLIMVRKH